MGLLDDFLQDPKYQGLLAAGLGILSGGGQPTYGQFGRQVGGGGLMGLQQYGQARQMKMMEDFRKAQEDRLNAQTQMMVNQQIADYEALNNLPPGSLMKSGVNPYLPPSPVTPKAPTPQPENPTGQVPNFSGPLATKTPYMPGITPEPQVGNTPPAAFAPGGQGGGPSAVQAPVAVDKSIISNPQPNAQGGVTAEPVAVGAKSNPEIEQAWKEYQAAAASANRWGLSKEVRAQKAAEAKDKYDRAMMLTKQDIDLNKWNFDKETGLAFKANGAIGEVTGYKDNGEPDIKPITSARALELGLQVKTAGATKLQNQINAYMPASEEAQRDFIKSTRATYDQLKQAPAMLNSIEKAKALIPGAAGFMGPGGESLLEAAKFLNNRVGMSINTEGVKNAEELRTRIFFNIMDNLKKMDAQPSQQQQIIMQEALGKLGTDPNALPNILDAFAEVIKDKVKLHNVEVRSAINRGVKFPYDPVIDMESNKPAQPSFQSGGKVKRYNPNTGKIE